MRFNVSLYSTVVLALAFTSTQAAPVGFKAADVEARGLSGTSVHGLSVTRTLDGKGPLSPRRAPAPRPPSPFGSSHGPQEPQTPQEPQQPQAPQEPEETHVPGHVDPFPFDPAHIPLPDSPTGAAPEPSSAPRSLNEKRSLSARGRGGRRPDNDAPPAHTNFGTVDPFPFDPVPITLPVGPTAAAPEPSASAAPPAEKRSLGARGGRVPKLDNDPPPQNTNFGHVNPFPFNPAHIPLPASPSATAAELPEESTS